MTKHLFTAADKGQTVQVRQGDEVIIQLKENPTTGYRWDIDKTNATLLVQHNSEFSTPGGTGIGGGGTRTITFIAKSVGTVQLELKLWRAWQGDASITDRYNITIQIQ